MKTLPPLPYLGDDRLLLAEIDHALGEVGPILFRASERDKLARLAEHGTDRGGYPGERRWRGERFGGRRLRHEDVIFATTRDDVVRGVVEPDHSTSFKKLAAIEAPLVLIYDARALEEVGDREYAFRPGADRRGALVAVFPIEKIPMPQGWMTSDEGMAYRALVARAGGRIAEIGCWKGRSTSYVARLAHSMICVDHFAGSSDEYDAGYRRLLDAEDVELAFREHVARLGASVDLRVVASIEAAASVGDRSLDLVFLDASHDEAAVRADVAAWWPKLRSGGILAGHDYDQPGVARAVDHLGVVVGPGRLFHAVAP